MQLRVSSFIWIYFPLPWGPCFPTLAPLLPPLKTNYTLSNEHTCFTRCLHCTFILMAKNIICDKHFMCPTWFHACIYIFKKMYSLHNWILFTFCTYPYTPQNVFRVFGVTLIGKSHYCGASEVKLQCLKSGVHIHSIAGCINVTQ